MKYILLSILLLLNAIAYSQERGMSQTNNSKEAAIATGNNYAVIVGISNYKYVTPLSFADQDALLFKEFLQSKAGGSLKDDNILLLINDDAKASTLPRIRHWINNIKKPQKGDKVYFYFAGHGDAIDADEYFFLLQDCNPAGDKNNYVGGMASALPMYSIKSFIKNNMTEKGVQVLLIWDACRTNELPGGAEGMKIAQQGIAEKNSGELIMLSASAGETAIENNSYAHGHGLFTYYLIDGLSGAADNADLGGNADGKIDMSELDTYVKMKVRNDAKNKFKSNQNPKFIYNIDASISFVDEQFKQAWAMQKQSNDTYAYNAPKKTRTAGDAMDTMVTNLYNRIMQTIKLDSIDGSNGAEALLAKMEKQYPNNTLTQEAGFNLAMEYINLAQDKINLFLSGKEEKSSFNAGEIIPKIEKTLNTTNVTNANFLKKAMILLRKNGEQDEMVLNELEAKKNFFLGFSYYFTKEQDRIKEFKEALLYAEKALAAHPKAAYNNFLMAAVLMYKTDSALLYSKKAIELAPNWMFGFRITGALFIMNQQIDSAKYYFSKSLELQKNNTPALFFLSKIFVSKQQYDSAKLYTKKSIMIDSNSVMGYMSLADIFTGLKQHDSAKYILNQAINNSKIDYVEYAYQTIAQSCLSLEQYDSAIYYLKKAVIVNPTFEIAYTLIASTFNQLKQYDSVKYYSLKSILVNPDNYFSYLTLGNACFELKQYDLAIKYAKESIKINPHYLNGYDFLAMIFSELKQYDSAILYLEKAVINNPQNDAIFGIYYSFSCLYSLKKETDKALYYFELTLQNGWKDIAHIKEDTDLDNIRNTEKFKALIKKYFPNQ